MKETVYHAVLKSTGLKEVNDQKASVLEYVYNNPGVRVAEVKEHVMEKYQLTKGDANNVMLSLHMKGIIEYTSKQNVQYCSLPLQVQVNIKKGFAGEVLTDLKSELKEISEVASKEIHEGIEKGKEFLDGKLDQGKDLIGKGLKGAGSFLGKLGSKLDKK